MTLTGSRARTDRSDSSWPWTSRTGTLWDAPGGSIIDFTGISSGLHDGPPPTCQFWTFRQVPGRSHMKPVSRINSMIFAATVFIASPLLATAARGDVVFDWNAK